jgi:D-serine deaminase-like pyridoxal phosphate-dependent protein
VKLAELPTPCLVLDRGILVRNLDRMARAVERHGVTLRPHMKTAKSIDVARLSFAAGANPAQAITVSTLAEAEYFAAHGIADILYAVAITPQKLGHVAKLNAAGAKILVVTDDADVAAAIAAHEPPISALIEIDCGEGRSGVAPDDPALLAIGEKLGARLAGVMTHAGHSYGARTVEAIATLSAAERIAAVSAAARLRSAGHACEIVSIGSSPTALHGNDYTGVTELRAGVYMFGDLFQAEIFTHDIADIAVTVLASVIGRRPARNSLIVDAGGLALSKDRSTEAAPVDYGFGLVLDANGQQSYGQTVVRRAYQEHGVIDVEAGRTLDLPVGAHVRIAPNHTCMTAAAHDRYYVVDGDDAVIAIWPRVNGW